jgi:hypothetical protein
MSAIAISKYISLSIDFGGNVYIIHRVLPKKENRPKSELATARLARQTLLDHALILARIGAVFQREYLGLHHHRDALPEWAAI